MLACVSVAEEKPHQRRVPFHGNDAAPARLSGQEMPVRLAIPSRDGGEANLLKAQAFAEHPASTATRGELIDKKSPGRLAVAFGHRKQRTFIR